ncbi:MAG TPA: glycosyltransferase family 4 protein [Solirubrobacteraceae bacterium]|nr:glycosyltransferase family 4 protein [Solirubrobacteraceae bacterium]
MSTSPRPAREVTIVAHDIGSVGGMERVLGELILGLRERGHPVTVVARTCRLPASAGVKFHRVPGPARPVLLAYPWFMLLGSLILARRRRGVVQVTGAIVLNHVDVVSVHYLHCVGPVTPSRASLLYRVHAWLVSALLRLGERVLFARDRDAVFVGVSDGVADELREYYPRLRARVRAIHNGVDVETFAPQGDRAAQRRVARERFDVPAERLVAAFVGSEWERKGLEPAIRALSLAREWDLAVAGEGDRAHYQALADSLGVGGSLHWLGVLDDVHEAYALADAFLLPTSYETFSLVTFEAAASGLPLLVTPVNGVRELLRDGENGFTISREAEPIAAHLRGLGADASLRERLGACARESALAFSWEAMVAKHEELYEQLASEVR